MRPLLKVLLTAAVALTTAAASAADAPRISVSDLAGRLGEPQLVVIDARSSRDWAGAESMIQGAHRRDPGTVAAWAGEYRRDQPVVVYCS